MKDSSLLTWLRSIDDPNELARSLIEAGVGDHPDDEFAALVSRAIIGEGEYSQRLRAMVPRKKRKSSREQARRARQFDRIRAHHPALEKLTARKNEAEATPLASEQLEEVETAPVGATKVELHEGVPSELWVPPVEKLTTWDRELGRSLRIHLHENASVLRSHLYGPHHYPPPEGYFPAEPGSNPFQPAPQPARPMQASTLSAEDAGKVFDAISFAMWKHGKVMNAHVVIVWSMIPNVDEVRAAVILGKYLHSAGKWLGVGRGPRSRRRIDPRQGDDLHYVWVHENAPDRGFHTHIMLNLPFALRKGFDAWSRSYLARLCKTHFDWKAFRIVPSYAKTEETQVRGAWRWYRYMMKQLDAGAKLAVVDKVEGYSEVSLREVLRPWRARGSLSMPEMKRVGASHSIGERAQKKEEFLSKLKQASFDEIYQGRELVDRRAAELWKDEPHPPWRSEFKS